MYAIRSIGAVMSAALLVLGWAVCGLAQEKVPYKIISASELKGMMAKGERPLLIDAVPRIHYRQDHIPGARNFEFPNGAMDTWDATQTGGNTLDDFKALLGPDKKKAIVFYCYGTVCSRSAQAVSWALKLGYENVYRFPGGINAWKKAGYPVARGD